MWNVVQFPRTRIRDRTSGVRVTYVTDRWCVERLEAGDIIARSSMPLRADAVRIAARISRRDKTTLLPVHLAQRPSTRIGGHHSPDGHAA